ncbi:uncharacterized protein LOC108847412 [Raphanus sativus]|uniref:Uncharacterized protein LOC108847412 n=1 Tax=Raphanus sativus TaxID=3726 RepID=A0A6J0MUM1_RAPSA|nr:uncharacterized protein LOC108847412 [Raphanus sativus]
MHPARRSERLKATSDPPVKSSAAFKSTPVGSSSSRKNSRKRFRRRTRCTPPPEPSEPDAVSLSEGNSSDSDAEPVENPDPVHASEENEPPLELIPKEARYAVSRDAFQARARVNPERLRPSKRPFNPLFSSKAANERFHALQLRTFLEQQSMPLDNEDLQDVKEVVVRSGLIYTLTDVDSFLPSLIREFIANLVDAKKRDGGVAVYVRGSLVDFSPSWLEENIDDVCSFLSEGRVLRWEDMSSKFLTKLNQVLYKLVCTNWIPTTSYTAMNPERLRFVYMLHHHKRFNFGKLVYNQIISMAEGIKTEKTRRIIFPTLIQCVLPPDGGDDDYIGFPKPVVKDIKAGRGNGTGSHPPNLEKDIARTIASLKAVHLRLKSKILWGLWVDYVKAVHLVFICFYPMWLSAGGDYGDWQAEGSAAAGDHQDMEEDEH